MSIFDRFKAKGNGPVEITLQGIQSNYEKLDKASDSFLNLFGPEFTRTPQGHIATDIAGASSISGLMILRSAELNLSGVKPGSCILFEGSPWSEADLVKKQDPVFRYIDAIAMNMGVDPSPDPLKIYYEGLGENEPLFGCIDQTKKLEGPYILSCENSKLPRLYYPIAAALTAMKLVAAGTDMGIIDPAIGIVIAIHGVVAGSRTVPHPV